MASTSDTAPDSKNPRPQAVPDGVYLVDPDRTVVRFRAKAFGLLWVGGSLPVSGGELRIEGGHLRGTGTLAADRIDTGLRARDWHLRHAHYLHTNANPTIQVTAEGEPASGAVDAEVVVRGKPGRLELVVHSVEHTEDGLRIRAEGTLDRTPFAMLPPLAGVSRLVQVSVTLIARPCRPQ